MLKYLQEIMKLVASKVHLTSFSHSCYTFSNFTSDNLKASQGETYCFVDARVFEVQYCMNGVYKSIREASSYLVSRIAHGLAIYKGNTSRG